MTANKVYVYILAAVGTLGASVLRIVQNLIMIEPATGFFRDGYETANILIIAAVFAIVAVSALFGRICKDKPQKVPPKTRPFAAVHYLLAVSIILEAFLTEVSAATPAWQVVMHIILATLAALVLIIGGTFTLLRLPDRPMMYISLALLWMMKLIIIFANYTSLSTITENIFELGAICGILIYFLTWAKLMAGVTTDKVLGKILGVSVLSFMLCGTYALPQFFLLISGNAALIHSKNATFITALVVMIFIGYYIYLCYKKEKKVLLIKEERETAEE